MFMLVCILSVTLLTEVLGNQAPNPQIAHLFRVRAEIPLGPSGDVGNRHTAALT